jgi:hypothetical protein
MFASTPPGILEVGTGDSVDARALVFIRLL